MQQARAILEPILVSAPIDEVIAYYDNVVDQNSDDLICLRVGRPDENPHFGAPGILAIDNTTR